MFSARLKEEAISPCDKNYPETKCDRGQRLISGCDDGDEIAGKTCGLRHGGHISGQVGTQSRVLVRFEVGDADDSGRRSWWRHEVGDETDRQLVLPQKIERDGCRSSVGRKFRRVHLVEE